MSSGHMNVLPREGVRSPRLDEEPNPNTSLASVSRTRDAALQMHSWVELDGVTVGDLVVLPSLKLSQIMNYIRYSRRTLFI